MQATATIEIATSTVGELLANAGPLFKAHWDEIALNKSAMQLDPDEGFYHAMEEHGRLLVLAAFEVDGNVRKIVGYAVTFLSSHPHYRNLAVATNDLIYVDPKNRKGRVGGRLFKTTERLAKDRLEKLFPGRKMLMLWHCKPDSALLRALDASSDYGVQDIVFSKEL